MNLILFENNIWRNQLKPLTLTKPVAALRLGILTISEKWEEYLNTSVSYLTESYLQKKFTANYSEINTYINASFLPNELFINAIINLCENEALISNSEIVAFKSKRAYESIEAVDFEKYQNFELNIKISVLKQLPDLFLKNAHEIELDFKIVTQNRVSAEITDKFTAVYNPENIFIEEGANIKAAILNAENGPIYIGKNAIVQEGSLVIGPASVGDDSMVAFGAKIRPNTSIGPVCRVGGEVGNSIFCANSNKAHDGFLGNSYIGQWCNLGANTNNSNLKNDYKTVKLYNYNTDTIDNTNELFVGTFMGDYSKAGISTMFNTGTVVGVSANVFGTGFQDKFIPSFSWGGKAEGIEDYRFEKAVEVINATMARRNASLSALDLEILQYISDNHK